MGDRFCCQPSSTLALGTVVGRSVAEYDSFDGRAATHTRLNRAVVHLQQRPIFTLFAAAIAVVTHGGPAFVDGLLQHDAHCFEEALTFGSRDPIRAPGWTDARAKECLVCVDVADSGNAIGVEQPVADGR